MPPNAERRTAITDDTADLVRIRGYALTELIDRIPFDAAVFLVLAGELPTETQRTVFSACLTAAIDHGPNAPSTEVARRAASNGVPLTTAVAAGVASIGEFHGGAIEQAGRLLTEGLEHPGTTAERAGWVLATGTERYHRIPGFGHRVYTTTDPRVDALFAVAERNGIATEARALARGVEAALERSKGKRLPLNVDGGMAAVLLGLGLPWRLYRGVFAIARSVGLVAHAAEQQDREPPVVRSETRFAYDGPGERTIPEA